MIWEISLVNIMKCLLWEIAVSWNGSMSGHIPVCWRGLRGIPTRIETTDSTELNRLYFDQCFMGQRDCLGQEESRVPYARKGDGRNADNKSVEGMKQGFEGGSQGKVCGWTRNLCEGEGKTWFPFVPVVESTWGIFSEVPGPGTLPGALVSLWWPEHMNPGTCELTTELGCVLGLWQQGEENSRCWSKLTTE